MIKEWKHDNGSGGYSHIQSCTHLSYSGLNAVISVVLVHRLSAEQFISKYQHRNVSLFELIAVYLFTPLLLASIAI